MFTRGSLEHLLIFYMFMTQSLTLKKCFLDYFAQSFNVPLGGVQSVIYSIFCRLPNRV